MGLVLVGLIGVAAFSGFAVFSLLNRPQPTAAAALPIVRSDTLTPRILDEKGTRSTRVVSGTETATAVRGWSPTSMAQGSAAPTASATSTQKPPTAAASTSTPRATRTRQASATVPSNSPPAGHIVYTCFIDGVDDICRLDVSSQQTQRLTDTDATDFYASPGPEGKQVVFSSRRSGSFQNYIINANGSSVRLLSEHMNVYAPHISPDGRKLLFTYAYDDQQDIWVMDISGSNARALTDTPAEEVDPVWSPDGTKIAFASDRSGELHHYVMDMDGDNVQVLPAEVDEIGGRSDWSPDGQWLAFYAGPRNDRDIYLVATDGSGDIVRLTDGGGNLAPSFSPDGQWITFLSYRDGDGEIFIMRADGSEASQLTHNDWTDWQPRWGP